MDLMNAAHKQNPKFVITATDTGRISEIKIIGGPQGNIIPSGSKFDQNKAKMFKNVDRASQNAVTKLKFAIVFQQILNVFPDDLFPEFFNHLRELLSFVNFDLVC